MRRDLWLDLALAALLVVFALFGTGPAAENQARTAPVGAYVLAVVAGLSLIGWRTWPMWTFAVAGTASVVYLAAGYAYGPILIALALAVLGMSLRSELRRSLAGTATLVAAGLVAVAIGVVGGSRNSTEFVSVAAWFVLPAALGMVIKTRRDAGAAVRSEQARRAVSEERLRLAQEVHDVAGHGLAVIAMQAGVALRVLDHDPHGVRTALEAIREVSTDALAGLRAEVQALRQGDGVAEAPLRPRSGLADLAALAERMRSSGLPVVVDSDVDAATLPAELDLAAYRIVQESLTNVLRHAGPHAAAEVHIGLTDGVLHVEVLDTGRGGAARSDPGTGIDGMRGRAEALGGSLVAGSRPQGGFAVRARLPISPHPFPSGGAG